MAARITALVALACLAACSKAPSSPSRLEKSCPTGSFYVPCHIKDEALSQQWNV